MEPLVFLYAIPFLYLILKLWKHLDAKRDQECYILDYQCFKPTDDRMLGTELCRDLMMRSKSLGIEEFKFLLKAVVNSGIGEQTYGPKVVFSATEHRPSLLDAISEMEEFFQDSLQKLFDKSGVSPSEINILVVNISSMSTSPSFASKIINRYKMREDIKALNLSGMGCSASLISIDVVRRMFKSYKNSYAIVVTSESLTPNWYLGNDRSMILANCLFRTGGAAVLLTNRRALKKKAMLKLKCLVRTHHGAFDESYGCCVQKEDDKGNLGIHLGKDLPKAATKAFIHNLREISPKILPITQILRLTLNHNPQTLPRHRHRHFLEAAEAQLPNGGGAFLPAHGRKGSDRRGRKEPEANRRRSRASQNDPSPIRQHVGKQPVVRSGIHGGEEEAEEGRASSDDNLRRGV